MDVVTPTRGKETPEACTGEKGGCSTKDTLAGLDLGGSCSPPERWPWEAHDVTLVTLDVTQRRMDMIEVVVCQVACVASSGGLGRTKVFLMETNVTLGGHDVTSTAHFRV
jgi:hypothetical protein